MKCKAPWILFASAAWLSLVLPCCFDTHSSNSECTQTSDTDTDMDSDTDTDTDTDTDNDTDTDSDTDTDTDTDTSTDTETSTDTGTEIDEAIIWQRSYGGSEIEIASYGEQTTDGGYIVAGFTESNDGDVVGHHGGRDIWVLKLTEDGDMSWQRCLGGSGEDISMYVLQTSDGGYIVPGWSDSTDGDVMDPIGHSDIWLIKLTAEGEISWQKNLGGSDLDGFPVLQETTDGGYIMAAASMSSDGDVSYNNGDADVWLAKLTSLGEIDWEKSIGGSRQEYPGSIQLTPDGGYILSASSKSADGDVTFNHGDEDYWIVKLSSTGEIIWQQNYGGSAQDTPYYSRIHRLSDGGFIVGGLAWSNDGYVLGNHGKYDTWVLRMTPLGDLIWAKALGGSETEESQDIIPTADDTYVVASRSASSDGDVSFNFGEMDWWLVKLDIQGNILWERSFGGSERDVPFCIQQTTDKNYLVIGESASTDGDVIGNHGISDFWIVKIRRDLNTID